MGDSNDSCLDILLNESLMMPFDDLSTNIFAGLDGTNHGVHSTWGSSRGDVGSKEDVANGERTMSVHEKNYERKKERAKVSRVEVNQKFNELIDLLNVSVAGRSNRARVLDAAIQRIKSLETQVKSLKSSGAETTPSVQMSMVLPGSTLGPPAVWFPYSMNPTTLIHNQPDVSKFPRLDKFSQSKKRRRRQFHKSPCKSSVLMVLSSWLEFLDWKSLVACSNVCTNWRKNANTEHLWDTLCEKRWGLRIGSRSVGLEKWIELHEQMCLPVGAYTNTDIPVFARGRSLNVDTWVLLAHRSNCCTPRTLNCNGIFRLMDIIELRVVIQNVGSPCPVRMAADAIEVRCSSGYKLRVLSSEHGLRTDPKVLSRNGRRVDTDTASSVIEQLNKNPLHELEWVVFQMFVSCQGCPMEEQFLDMVASLRICYMIGDKLDSVLAVFEQGNEMRERYGCLASGAKEVGSKCRSF